MADRRYYIILNANSGTALAKGITAERLKGLFEAVGHDATVDADVELSFAQRIERALASGAEVLVAAGGDGTVTALAQAVAGTDRSLAVLPLGTVNSLARELHLSLNLEQAIAEIGSLEPRRIDVGELNGQLYLHYVVIGLVPGMAMAREHIRQHQTFGAKLALVRHFARRLSRARRLAVAIEPNAGKARVERLQAVAVANNAYEQRIGQGLLRDRLDRGLLTLYVVSRLNLRDFLRLSLRMLVGRWHEDETLRIESARALTIRSRKPKLKVMFDGEVMMFDTPLEFRVRPLALSVLAPPEAAIAAPEADLAADPLRPMEA